MAGAARAESPVGIIPRPATGNSIYSDRAIARRRTGSSEPALFHSAERRACDITLRHAAHSGPLGSLAHPLALRERADAGLREPAGRAGRVGAVEPSGNSAARR